MIALALLLAAPPIPTRPTFDPAIDETKLVVLCDPVRFRFSVRASADAASVDRSYPQRVVIAPSDLMQGLPGWTGGIEVLGPLIRYERCGPYTVKLQGDAYNTYIQGESGAYDSFAAVSVIGGNRLAYPPDGGAVRFVDCDRSLPRASECPKGFAVRLDAVVDMKAKMLVMTETTTSHDEMATGDDASQTTRRTIRADADWSLWHPED